MSTAVHRLHRAYGGIISAENIEAQVLADEDAVFDLSGVQPGFDSSGLCLHLGHVVNLGVQDVV
jgi:hypothetical protein